MDNYFLPWITLSVLVYVCSGVLILDKNEITVKIGRSVFLRRNDLVFVRTSEDEDCRVEVVENDPITQRAGRLEPRIFDCNFLPNTIKYEHNGSPFLTNDRVKLRVHKFTPTSTLTETFYLDVRIMNTTQRVILTRGLRPVVVPEFNGISNAIDGTVIRFYHTGSMNVTCNVRFSKLRTHWPIAGRMVVGGDRREPIRARRTSCREFLFMHLHYEHTRAPSPDVDFFPLTVELSDSSISEETIIENYFLPIHIKGASPNRPPTRSFMSMYMMDVDQFVLSTILPDVISAEDFETPNSLLVYNISRQPSENEGYFVSLDDHTTKITSFLQSDLTNHRIAYQPPSINHSKKRVYETEFTVFDGHFASSMPITLHIAIRTSATSAPRVSYNKGLVLLEGQSRPITSSDLQIVDRDNLNRVRLYVTGGLKYGRLEINGRRAIAITVQDIQRRSVVYYHDDSDTTKDNIAFRISDGVNTVLVNFPITIIPKDDSPPYVLNNIGLRMNEGGTMKFTTDILSVTDTDSVDRNIIFIITQPPKAGEIIRRVRPTDTGTRINRFIQRDLLKGQIYYHHFGHEIFRDSFQFRLRDHEDPPNKSGVETFHIDINPVNENPPRLAPQATRIIHVLETDVAYITKAELEYTDVETDNGDLTYVITSTPYFVYDMGPSDAGRLIATHNLTNIMKDYSIPAVYTFTQADINHMKIAYMPPQNDIGPQARLVKFVYTVQDSSGNKVLGQYFEIDVQPVNNQPPVFITSKLLVEESGILGISMAQLSASDTDTPTDELEFILDEAPRYGVLQYEGRLLEHGDTFRIDDLKKKLVRYIHDGADEILDTFTLSLSDGVNRAIKVLSIDIVPIDDKAPQLRENLRPRLIVSEGGQVVITSMVLAATDDDTDDQELVFLIVKQPKHGIIQLQEQPATKFTQRNVEDRLVQYIHTGGEIGTAPVKDSVTFIVSDQNYMASADLPVYELNITITPVDNSKPTLIIAGEVNIDEGGSFQLIPDIITAKDPDTPPEDIAFFLVRQPQWGYLENIKPNPGSEKSNTGRRISSFKLQDIIDQTVNYVQANHKGVEPVYDEFQLYATDGALKSNVETLVIRIDPQNDEVPDVMLQDLSMEEGGSVVFDQSILDAIDMDIPRDPLTLSISQPPRHGEIVKLISTDGGEVEAEIHDFSIDELHSGLQLKYKHDNSEHFTDTFALTVSDGRHEIKKLCNITINPLNDERPEVIKNAGLQIEYGDYGLISSIVLQTIDPDNSENEVVYVLMSVPKKGFLQFCSEPFTPTRSSDCYDMSMGMNFTQHDVDMNRIRYLHTTSMGNSDTDSFQFMLTDGSNRRHIETFEIRIRNSMKANLALLNRGMEVREGERSVINTNSLSASDESTQAGEIVFAIIRPPKLGKIEYINQPLVSISSFTQMDLAAQNIVYNHLTKSDITEDSFTFTVTNGLSQAKDGEFNIEIEPLDRILPSLNINRLIEVLQGGDVILSPIHLKAQDPDSSDVNITYVIVKPPTYGHLYNRGVLITQHFTQNDINLGHIAYASDESHAGLDNFLFILSDGKHDGFLVNGTLELKPVICSIFAKPVVNDAPKLIVSNHPETLEYFGNDRYGFRMNNRNLKVVDSDTDNHKLMYIITKRPMHGQIENAATERYVRRKFTQKDLDDSNLRYVVDPDTKFTNDSFMFRVMDSRGNTLENQRFSLKWSVVFFKKSRIVVCEDIGTLSVVLGRRGSLDSMAFVGIEVNEMSAKEGQDFTPSTAQQVQFNPGEGQAHWDINIANDGLEENTEKFKLILQEPVNAILGMNSKVTTRIINAENGECPQYFGMISKHSSDNDGFFLGGERGGEILEEGRQPLDSRVVYNKVVDVPVPSPLDNTYNTDPRQSSTAPKSVSRTAPSDGSSPTTRAGEDNETVRTRSKKKKTRQRKRNKKGGKRSKGKKRRRNGKTKQSSRKSNQVTAQHVNGKQEPSLFSKLSSPSMKIQAPQECALSTRGLLHFDEFAQRMYKCDGESWKAWKTDQDQSDQDSLCEQDWVEFEGRCYKLFTDRLNWDEAETMCQSSLSNAHLTSVRSRRHFKWLIKMSNKNSFWIGLNDKASPKDWRYSNGEDVTYSRWARGRPRIRRTVHRKNCVLVNKRRKWKNKLCNKYSKRFICEHFIPSTSKPKRQVSRSRRYKKSRTIFEGF